MDFLVSADSSELFKTYLSDMVTVTLEFDTSATRQQRKVHRDHNLEWFFKKSKMLFAPGLDEVIASETPPSVEFFLSLPDALQIDSSVLRKYLVLYEFTMEQEG